MEFDTIICGGTFDTLHAGHKAFLSFAFSKGRNVIIGLTSDAYVKKYKKDQIVSGFDTRQKELQAYLMGKGFLDRAHIVAIDSRFDQTQLKDKKMGKTALLVSSETHAAGKEINKEREKNGLDPLLLLVFPIIKNEENEKISSSKIREGMMTREGIMLPHRDFLSKPLLLPDSLRQILHKPFGILFLKEIPKQFLRNPQKIVTVGDVITKRIHDVGIQQKLAIIDFFVERKKTNESLSQMGFVGNENIIHAINPAGRLTPNVWKKLLAAMSKLSSSKNTVIVVEGEEDLLVIPLILTLPLGFFVMYGQPQEGVVILEITEKLKHQTFDILKQFVQA